MKRLIKAEKYEGFQWEKKRKNTKVPERVARCVLRTAKRPFRGRWIWPLKTQDACALPRKKKEERNMARPRKTEIRDRQLKLCLTAHEYETIRQRAQALGLRPVHFGRALLLGRAEAPASHEDAPRGLVRMIYSHLTRIGNNLNQIARHCHITGDPLPADLEPLLKDIRQLVERMRS